MKIKVDYNPMNKQTIKFIRDGKRIINFEIGKI